MPVFLNSLNSNFANDFETLLSAKREDSVDVDLSVREIIGAVKERGDQGYQYHDRARACGWHIFWRTPQLW